MCLARACPFRSYLWPPEASTIELCQKFHGQLHDGVDAELIEVLSYTAEFGIGLPFTQMYARHSEMTSICSLQRKAPKLSCAVARPVNIAGMLSGASVESDVPDLSENIDNDEAADEALEADEFGDGDGGDEPVIMEDQDHSAKSPAAHCDDRHDEPGEDGEPLVEEDEDTVGCNSLSDGSLSRDAISAGVALWQAEIAHSLNCLRDHAESTSPVPLEVGAYGEMSLARFLKYNPMCVRACIFACVTGVRFVCA